jgi:hypothetical protein
MLLSGAGSMSARAGERARGPAHVRGRPGEGLQRPDQTDVLRRRADRRPQLGVEEERAQQRRVPAQADFDGIEEGIRRRLREQREHVGERLPGPAGGIPVGVLGDRADHALGMLLARGTVVEWLCADVPTEERGGVRYARPQPRRVGPRLAYYGGHEPALNGNIERGIVLFEDTLGDIVKPVQRGLRDQCGDQVPSVLLGHNAPRVPVAGDRRVVLGGPCREVALDVGVRAAREGLDRRAIAVDVVGPRAREDERGEVPAQLPLGPRRPREPRVGGQGPAERQQVAVRVRGAAVGDVPGDPGGLVEDRLCRRRAIEQRDHDVPLRVPSITAQRDHDMVSLAQRARDVGVVEVRDQHEGVVRVDEPVPRAGRGDDDRAGAQLVDLIAVAEKAGAQNGERLLPGRRDDRDRPRALADSVADLGDHGVATGEKEPAGKNDAGLADPPVPPRVGRPDVARIPAELLRNPVMHAGRALQPGDEVIGVVCTDASPGAVLAPGPEPVVTLPPQAARHRDERGRLRVEAERVRGPAVHVGLGLGSRTFAGAQLPPGGSERDMGVRDVGPDDPVPAGQERTFARAHRDLGDRRGGQDEPADQHREPGLRSERAGPLIEVDGGDQLGIAHAPILPDADAPLGRLTQPLVAFALLFTLRGATGGPGRCRRVPVALRMPCEYMPSLVDTFA